MPTANIRFSDKEVDTSILGEKLKFPFSGLETPNRFMKGPMTERLSSWDQHNPSKRGVPSDKLVRLYEHWGAGEIGCIISGNIMIHPENLEAAGNMILESNHDGRLEMFKKLGVAAKKHGSIFIGQISHPGRQVFADINPNPVSASDVQLTGGFAEFGKPTPLSKEGIKEIVNRFAATSELLYQAGWDGIQLHGAHGYLLAQFLSNTTNKRTDEYGGSLENRARIILETVAEIRRRVPDTKFSIGIKINSVEFQAGGFTTEECRDLCKSLEQAGVDFVDLSGGTYEALAFEHKKESTKKRESFFLEFADIIRPALTKTIVYVTGGFRTASAMVDAVKNGSTDGIGLGRPLCDEPHLCKKLLRKEIPVWAARKPVDIEGGQWMEVAAAGMQIDQIANDLEPVDISDEKESEKVKQAMLAAQAEQAELKKKGIINAGHPKIPGYAVPYHGTSA